MTKEQTKEKYQEMQKQKIQSKIDLMTDDEIVHYSQLVVGRLERFLYREELKKRLSKNKPEIWSYTNITPEQAVEEFKNELIKEILDEFPVTGVKHLEDIKFLNRDVIIDIIKNTK